MVVVAEDYRLGYALTSFHVVQDAATVLICQGSNTYTAQVVRVDRANDIALLKARGRFACLALGNSEGVRLGDPVATIGFPNPEVQGTSPKVTKGEISSISGIQDDPRLFQVSVPIQPGNSGGPLLSKRGDVIGITAASLNALGMLITQGSIPQNVNYAVKITYAGPLLGGVNTVKPEIKVGPQTAVPETDFTRLATSVFRVLVGAGAPESHLAGDGLFDQRRCVIEPTTGSIVVTIRNNNPFYVKNLHLRIRFNVPSGNPLARPPILTWNLRDLVAPAENYEVYVLNLDYAPTLRLHSGDSEDPWYPVTGVPQRIVSGHSADVNR